MKKRKMIDLVGFADEKYISEADPTKPRARQKFKWSAFLASAACLLLVLNIAILVPLLSRDDGISSPSGNNPTVNSSLNHIKNPIVTPPADGTGGTVLVENTAVKNALDKLFANGYWNGNGGIGDAVEDTEGSNNPNDDFGGLDKIEDEMDDMSSSLDGSTDIHDGQVAGVTEGDIAKKSDTHLFYLRGSDLYIYSINKEISKAECILPLGGYLDKLTNYFRNEDEKNESLDKENWEMYLSPDYKTLTVIITADTYLRCTGMLSLDVSCAPFVELIDFKMFAGTYISSRITPSGELLMFTSYKVYKGYDKENPLSYMPFYVEQGTEHLASDIYFPEELSSNSYVMVTRIGSDLKTVKETCAYLSYGSLIYVSQNNIFLTRQKKASVATSPSEGVPDILDIIMKDGSESILTEIAVIGYDSQLFKNKGTVTIDGYLKDRYSLDENNGFLRAATTTRKAVAMGGYYTSGTSASLFLIDLEKMEIKSSVLDFAPIDEIVRSVRYDGKYAYVCTSLQEVLSDPVFFFDLSDPDNITYTDTGVIDGYSTSLINIGNGYLLGVGVGNSSTTLKIEVYKEEGDKVVSVCSFELENTYYSTDYKSYMVDRARGIVGLAIRTRVIIEDYAIYQNEYLVLRFSPESESFTHIESVKINHSNRGSARAFEKDGYLYIATDKEFKATTLSSIGIFDYPEVDEGGENTTTTPELDEITDKRDPTKPAW